MVAYTKPQKRKNGKSERLRGEGDQIKFIYLGFERRKIVGFGNGEEEEGKMFQSPNENFKFHFALRNPSLMITLLNDSCLLISYLAALAKA